MVWPNEKMKKLDHPPQFDMFPRRPARVATVGADTWNPLSNLNSLIPDSLLPVKFNGGTCESSGVLPVDSLSEALPPAVCIESDWEHPSFPAFFWKIQKTPQAHAVLGNIYPIQRKTLENETCWESASSGWTSKPCQVSGPLHECFERLAWTQTAAWDGANLKETMFYLRRSKLICLPQEWKKLIPVDEATLNSFCS